MPLIGAMYFMTSGGPYGIEEIVHKAGYANALIILAATPLLWSLPTALMVAELSSAIPEEGGYYVWVRRALGPFWGFLEAWLTLAASVFDLALYPTLFVLYLGRIWPTAGNPPSVMFAGAVLIAACAAWNIGGVRKVGGGAVVMLIALLVPFVVLTVAALAFPAPVARPAAPPRLDLVGGILIAMWNYMGWDNPSTFAAEVERPQRTYPLALFATLGLVAAAYLAPVAAVWRSGVEPSAWQTGSWVDVARLVGGNSLALAIAAGGMLCGLGMLNALMLSYSRLALVLAEDGFLPRALTRLHPRTGAPWAAILVLAVLWTACLGFGFERLIEIGVILFGLSILLEFVALVVLRVREPSLPRPFRVPGGLTAAVALGLGPLVLILLGIARDRSEQTGVSALVIQALVIGAAPVVYFAGRRFFGGEDHHA